MVSFTRMTVVVLLEYGALSGAGYLYKFAWKKRNLRNGTPTERKQYSHDLQQYRNKWIAIALIVWALLSLVEAKAHATDVTSWLVSVLGKEIAQVIIASMVVILGFAASFLRKKNQVVYGLIEIGFGFVGAIVAAGHVTSADALFPAAATLVGCVYVVVRGSTNIEEAS